MFVSTLGNISISHVCLNRFAVIAHGFANAWGSFMCCLAPLSEQFNVIAIDWVGNGRSIFGMGLV